MIEPVTQWRYKILKLLQPTILVEMHLQENIVYEHEVCAVEPV